MVKDLHRQVKNMNGKTGQILGLLMLNYQINVWHSPKGTTLTKWKGLP